MRETEQILQLNILYSFPGAERGNLYHLNHFYAQQIWDTTKISQQVWHHLYLTTNLCATSILSLLDSIN